MSNKEFDKLIREKLNNFSEEVAQSDELWSSINAQLDAKQSAKIAYLARTKKIIYSISSIAAILIIAIFIKLAPNSTKPHIDVAQTVITQKSISQPKEEPIELQQNDNAVLAKTQTLIKGTLPKTIQASNHVTEPEYVAEVGDLNSSNSSVSSKQDTTTSNIEESISDLNKSYYAEFYEPIESRVERERRFNINVASGINTSSNGSNAYPKSMLSSGGNTGITSVEQVSDTKYSLPISVGVQAKFNINKILSIGIGLNYSMLKSSYNGLINKKMCDIKQTLHYIGVPINLYGSFVKTNRINCYANVGGVVEKGLKAVSRVTSYDDRNRYTNSIKGIEYSLNGGLGVEYKLTNLIGIYLEPNLVYYINSEVANSIKTAQPLQFKTELGLRFNL